MSLKVRIMSEYSCRLPVCRSALFGKDYTAVEVWDNGRPCMMSLGMSPLDTGAHQLSTVKGLH